MAWGPPRLLFNGYRWVLSPTVQRPGRTGDHPLPFSTEVNNEWSCTCTPHIYLHGSQRDKVKKVPLLLTGSLPSRCPLSRTQLLRLSRQCEPDPPDTRFPYISPATAVLGLSLGLYNDHILIYVLKTTALFYALGTGAPAVATVRVRPLS
jgi:hypothetical protein